MRVIWGSDQNILISLTLVAETPHERGILANLWDTSSLVPMAMEPDSVTFMVEVSPDKKWEKFRTLLESMREFWRKSNSEEAIYYIDAYSSAIHNLDHIEEL